MERFAIKVIRFTNVEVLKNVDEVIGQIRWHIRTGEEKVNL